MRLALILFFLSSLHLTAQRILFSAELGDSAILISDDVKLVSKLIFYVSDVQLETTEGAIIKMASYHLVDFSDSNSLRIEAKDLEKRDIKSIQFQLGIDSVTNVSGAFGGALDPTKGMYWSWQSGYINFKIEGRVQDENYILHLGGYSSPYKSVQQVILPVVHQSDEFKIVLPLNELFKKVIPQDNTVMSPSVAAVDMSKSIASFFYLK